MPEWHPGGHGLHVHFAVGRFIAPGAIEAAWGRGFVHIKLLGDLPVGSGSLGEARLAARYLSKYVGKDLGDGGQPAGLHRYEVAAGLPAAHGRRLDGTTADEVLGWAESVMGRRPSRVWRSRDQEDWAGPPAVWASWDVKPHDPRGRAGVGRADAGGAGAPGKLEDPVVIAEVASARSGSPDGLDAIGVEGGPAADGRPDHGSVQERGDDRALTVQGRSARLPAVRSDSPDVRIDRARSGTSGSASAVRRRCGPRWALGRRATRGT